MRRGCIEGGDEAGGVLRAWAALGCARWKLEVKKKSRDSGPGRTASLRARRAQELKGPRWSPGCAWCGFVFGAGSVPGAKRVGLPGAERGARRAVRGAGRAGAGAWCAPAAGAGVGRQARESGRAGRRGYWPRAGRRVALRVLPPAPARLIFSKQNNFADGSARRSWMFQVGKPDPRLQDNCLLACILRRTTRSLCTGGRESAQVRSGEGTVSQSS